MAGIARIHRLHPSPSGVAQPWTMDPTAPPCISRRLGFLARSPATRLDPCPPPLGTAGFSSSRQLPQSRSLPAPCGAGCARVMPFCRINGYSRSGPFSSWAVASSFFFSMPLWKTCIMQQSALPVPQNHVSGPPETVGSDARPPSYTVDSCPPYRQAWLVGNARLPPPTSCHAGTPIIGETGATLSAHHLCPEPVKLATDKGDNRRQCQHWSVQSTDMWPVARPCLGCFRSQCEGFA